MSDGYTKNLEEVMNAERAYIHETGGESGQKAGKLVGLALSGGGIRSASFGLGVLQALVSGKVLDKVDYLSTVSGGGYLGSSLTWFLSQKMPGSDKHYGTKSGNFPFGRPNAPGRTQGEKPNAVLDFIRQHGNYLIPGQGLNLLSLVGVTLRALLVSLVVHFSLFTCGIWLLHKITKGLFALSKGSALERLEGFGHWLFLAAGLLAVTFVAGSFLYSLSTFLLQGSSTKKYGSRKSGQKILGVLLSGTFVCLLRSYLGDLGDEIAAGGGTILGSLVGFLQYRKAQKANQPEKGGSFQIYAGVFLLLYGLALGSFILALTISRSISSGNFIFSGSDLYILIPLGVALVFGLIVNTNYLSPHRMYRDRLMETFLPNPEAVATNQWGKATNADVTLIETMCQSPNRRPYHLINTNLVLVDSPTSKYRGRGGDNFVLSPLYCGSDATGWRESREYMKAGRSSGMTLPTAMATSAAALNPNTGVAGQDPTRNRLVSALLSILNLRLGYVAPHPDPDKAWSLPPNFLYPGLRDGIVGGGLRENRRMIELSDGGHFENLALYELIRRKCDVIIAIDGGADPEFEFGDLSNASEKARVDLGAKISFPDLNEREETDPEEEKQPGEEKKTYGLKWLLPRSAHKSHQKLIKKYDLAERGFAVGEIRYADRPPGTLLYIKTTMTPDLSPDIYGYKSAHPDFPDQSTADQFFDETQFEAYRELGYHLGWQMLKANKDEKWI